jgi:hypothetical protein
MRMDTSSPTAAGASAAQEPAACRFSSHESIGIGVGLAPFPLPHHRARGSVHVGSMD